MVDFDDFWEFVGSSRQNYATSHALSSPLLGMRFAFLIQQDSKLRSSPLWRCPPRAELNKCLDVIVEVFSLFSEIFGVTAARFSSYSSIVETKWLHDFQGRVMPTTTGSYKYNTRQA